MDPHSQTSPIMNKRLNVRLLVRLGAGLLAGFVLLHGLHLIQAARHARHFKREGLQAAEHGDLPRSALYLGRSLTLRPNDLDMSAQHGEALARLAHTPRAQGEAYHSLSRVLRRDPGNLKVRQALGGLAVNMGKYDEAFAVLEPLRGAPV